MRKYICSFFLLIISIFLCMTNVYAESTCDYNALASLNKSAGKVKVAYNLNSISDGVYSFDISIYNITDDIYVVLTNDFDTESIMVTKSMTTDGTYTFNTTNTTDIITYSFLIKDLKYGCTNDLRNLKLVKPMYNEYSKLDICQYEDVQDFYYCQEWLTSKITLSEFGVRQKIEEAMSINNVTTTVCLNCQANNNSTDLLNQIKTYLIIGLSIGIVIDLIIIIVLLRNIRRNRI